MNELPVVTDAGWLERWAGTLVALVVVQAVLLTLYRETGWAMVEIWARSDTYAHGFLVLPIVLWLIWSLRVRLSRLLPQANFLAMALAAGAGFVWLTAQMANVAALAQFALVGLIALVVPMLCGWRVAREIAFPLGFLFFAVPFGDFALPQLMDWTANATVLGLRLSGIPVYREGLQFVIPSGNWSVVEACSGVRYLIASVVVGTLYAYLTYRSLKRRLIFVGIAFLVPVLANWMRAYMIVMIGHWSGNTLAVGVDHLIYGWLFFGVVIMMLFWIGSRWREFFDDQDLLPADTVPAAQTQSLRPFMAASLAITVCAIWPAVQGLLDKHLSSGPVVFTESVTVPGWRSVPDSPLAWKPRFENPSAEQQALFAAGEHQVGVYLAYYRNQNAGRKLVSSTNVLVTSSDRQWSKVGGGARGLAVQGQELEIRTAELLAAEQARLTVWQWYWVNGQLTANDYVAKAYTALYRLMGRGDDSAVIILHTPKVGAGNEDAILEVFAKAAAPVIARQLEQLREQP